MKIFTSTTFTWWQLGLFKWSIFLFGIGIGATWSVYLERYAVHAILIGALISLYVGLVWFKQHRA